MHYSHALLPEIWMIKESCNLIGQWHFGLKFTHSLVNANLLTEIRGLHRKTDNFNIFHFSFLLQQKVLENFLKSHKNSILGPFRVFFANFKANKIFLEKPILFFFSVSRFLLMCRMSGKKNRFRGKLVTDVQTD